ncbi:MAG: septal ring lytic transglycosylase RlpA family protein [Candidatus Obscuribacterales bacterium]|nr:septal ring lytic transglycosylase RlpA family protein [Candidatus Obscuribacterales bacterium]
MRTKRTFGILSLTLGLLMSTAPAAMARDSAAEVVSKVWVENGNQIAAVTVNGDEVYRFKGDDADEAAEEAEDLAVRLQELIDKKVDPSLLLPARDDDNAAIKLDGQTVLSFDPLAGRDDDMDDKKEKSFVFDASLKFVNRLREVLGVALLPSNYPDLSDPRSIDRAIATFSGQASWYGGKFDGRRTSDGSRFDQDGMTAAHRTLPFGTKLLVKNRKTGQSCVVEVNDRGPFIDGRVIDLSRGAARQLNMLGSGVAVVDCLVLEGQLQ